MLGRGTRVISETDFQAVTTTPQAHKTRFVIVDAVGVTEQELVDTGTVERKRSVPLKALLEAVAVGAVDEDVLASLARRLGLLEKRLSSAQRQEVESLLDYARRAGALHQPARALQRPAGRHRPGRHLQAAQATSGDPESTPNEEQI